MPVFSVVDFAEATLEYLESHPAVWLLLVAAAGSLTTWAVLEWRASQRAIRLLERQAEALDQARRELRGRAS
jgi:hypothetical protein